MRVKDCYTPSVLAEAIPLKKGVNIWFTQPGFQQCLQFETWQRKKSKVSVSRWDGY